MNQLITMLEAFGLGHKNTRVIFSARTFFSCDERIECREGVRCKKLLLEVQRN